MNDGAQTVTLKRGEVLGVTAAVEGVVEEGREEGEEGRMEKTVETERTVVEEGTKPATIAMQLAAMGEIQAIATDLERLDMNWESVTEPTDEEKAEQEGRREELLQALQLVDTYGQQCLRQAQAYVEEQAKAGTGTRRAEEPEPRRNPVREHGPRGPTEGGEHHVRQLGHAGREEPAPEVPEHLQDLMERTRPRLSEEQAEQLAQAGT